MNDPRNEQDPGKQQRRGRRGSMGRGFEGGIRGRGTTMQCPMVATGSMRTPVAAHAPSNARAPVDRETRS
jgi:hypothetical protein